MRTNVNFEQWCIGKKVRQWWWLPNSYVSKAFNNKIIDAKRDAMLKYLCRDLWIMSARMFTWEKKICSERFFIRYLSFILKSFNFTFIKRICISKRYCIENVEKQWKWSWCSGTWFGKKIGEEIEKVLNIDYIEGQLKVISGITIDNPKNMG